MEIRDDPDAAICEGEHMNDGEEGTDLAEISLHAILGQNLRTTIKLQGKIGSSQVLILVNGGSTHNFILEALVDKLGLTTEHIQPFGVQIGNEEVIRCHRICLEVTI